MFVLTFVDLQKHAPCPGVLCPGVSDGGVFRGAKQTQLYVQALQWYKNLFIEILYERLIFMQKLWDLNYYNNHIL